MTKKQALTTETIFPLAVAGLSLFNIFNHLTDILSLSCLLSLIGLSGTILYFLKQSFFRKLIFLWIIAQVVVIDRQTLDAANHLWRNNPLLDLTQGFSFKFGLRVLTGSNNYSINVNFLAILFFGLLKILEASSQVGRRFTFKQFRQESNLEDIFPLEGVVTKRINLSHEKDWLLIHLNKSFEYDDKSVDNIIVKRKDGGMIKSNEKKQIVFLRLVLDNNDIYEAYNESTKFPFVDWALCE